MLSASINIAQTLTEVSLKIHPWWKLDPSKLLVNATDAELLLHLPKMLTAAFTAQKITVIHVLDTTYSMTSKSSKICSSEMI
jgi:hypothetical protein